MTNSADIVTDVPTIIVHSSRPIFGKRNHGNNFNTHHHHHHSNHSHRGKLGGILRNQNIILEEENEMIESLNLNSKPIQLNNNNSNLTMNEEDSASSESIKNYTNISDTIISVNDTILNNSSSISSSNNTAYKKHRKNNKNKQQLDSDQEKLADSYEQSHFDLYKSSPNIVYIKQKYKMYLDWLSENTNKNLPDSTATIISTNSSTHHLNWYNYERSVGNNSSTENQNFKYIEHLEADNSAFHRNKALLLALQSQSSSASSSSHRLKPSYDTKSPKVIKQKIKIQLNTSDSSSGISSFTSNSSMPPIPSHNKLDYNQEKLEVVSSKGVKFESTSSNKLKSLSHHKNFNTITTKINNYLQNQMGGMYSSSNNSTPLLTISHNQQPIKPILKSHNSNDYYYVNGSTIQNRRGSVLSVSSNNSSEKNNSSISSSVSKGNLNSITNNLQNSLKLPPIARCSDDFYAVLHDLEKEKLV